MYMNLIKRRIKGLYLKILVLVDIQSFSAWIYQLCSIRNGNAFVYLSGGCIILLTFYCIGLIDHLMEKDFKEFKWPSYIDVREQVQFLD